MSRQLFTIGYEGTTIDDFINNLRTNHVDCILDVRDIPISRKRGFSKTALSTKLEDANINYVHFRDLGSPKPVREKLRSSGDYEGFFETMRAHVANKREAIESAYRHVINHSCCLMCFEHLAEECHRTIVALKIKERDGNGLKIKHI